MRSIHGLTAATSIGGAGTSIGPGRPLRRQQRDIDQYSPSNVELLLAGEGPEDRPHRVARTPAAAARAGRTPPRSGARCGPAPGCRGRAGTGRRVTSASSHAVAGGDHRAAGEGHGHAGGEVEAVGRGSAAARTSRYAVRPASVTTRPEKPAAWASRATSCICRQGRGVDERIDVHARDRRGDPDHRRGCRVSGCAGRRPAAASTSSIVPRCRSHGPGRSARTWCDRRSHSPSPALPAGVGARRPGRLVGDAAAFSLLAPWRRSASYCSSSLMLGPWSFAMGNLLRRPVDDFPAGRGPMHPPASDRGRRPCPSGREVHLGGVDDTCLATRPAGLPRPGEVGVGDHLVRRRCAPLGSGPRWCGRRRRARCRSHG